MTEEMNKGSSNQPAEMPPDDFKRFVLDAVHPDGETLTLRYGRHVFGGVVRCLLDPAGVEDALRPGTEIFIRYHTEESGAPGQVAQIIIRHPSDEGWAEIYADGV